VKPVEVLKNFNGKISTGPKP